ncbi:MAG TPA: M14 family zinc carboxypeptidase [Leptospiraceae bacterium]|nr:M14 family zinc carboxypeptidase [Leptospiraceae bacterium]
MNTDYHNRALPLSHRTSLDGNGEATGTSGVRGLFCLKRNRFKQNRFLTFANLEAAVRNDCILILISIHFFFSCSLLSQDVRYPNVPIYENKELVPYKIQNKHHKKFKKVIKKFFSSMPDSTYKGKNYTVYLLNKSEMKTLEKSNIPYESFSKSAPFKYYDINYESRLKRKFKDLDDLRSGYKDQRLNKIYLKAVSEKFPEIVTYFELGKTRLGRVIPAIRITSSKKSEYKIPILFTGAHHANELISTEHCYDIIYHLLNDYDKYEPYLENISVWIVPMVNPDGSNFFWNWSVDMGRKNGYLPEEMRETNRSRGVDLNRNYPFRWNSGNKTASSGIMSHVFYRGSSPASEPETQAMMSLANQERFLFAMSFHSYAAAILFPYTIENVFNPEPDYAKNLGNRIVKFAKSVRIGKDFSLRKNLYPVDGTDQDYYYHQHGTNAFIAESTHQNVDYEIVHSILKGFKGVWENLLYEFFHGNKIILRIEDEVGNPIEARVETEEIKHYEEENFTSHPETGIYVRMLLEEKEYNYLISKEGYEKQRVILKAGKSLQPNRVRLHKL